jgi:hypothetical protein
MAWNPSGAAPREVQPEGGPRASYSHSVVSTFLDTTLQRFGVRSLNVQKGSIVLSPSPESAEQISKRELDLDRLVSEFSASVDWMDLM